MTHTQIRNKMERRIIRYKDIQLLDQLSDTFGIISFQRLQREKIFKSNPDYDPQLTYLFLIIYKDQVVGRTYYFRTKIKIGDQILPAITGSAFEVAEPYRKYAFGADIILNKDYGGSFSFHLAAGIAPMALEMHKKLKFKIFAIPQYRLFHNARAYLAHKGVRSKLLDLSTSIINKVWNRKLEKFGKPNDKFVTKELTVVPEWVDDISLNDGHKYMEVHDHKWLQWQLMGSFAGTPGDYRKFFGIYLKDEPIGFFMTKRTVTLEKIDMSDGYIVEWGTKDQNLLSEVEIYKQALPTFGMGVSDIIFGSVDPNTQKEMKQLGFKRVNDEHIAVKTRDKSLKDISDPDLWRLRIGYTDTIFS